MNDFERWLSQSVWINGNQKDSRRNYIPGVTKYITNWMKANGYTMNGYWSSKAVAKWIYSMHAAYVYKKYVRYPEPRHRNWEEDYDQYYFVIDNENIEKCLEPLSQIEDFDSQLPLGELIRANLQQFLYIYLDLESSKQGILIAKLYDDSDSDYDKEHKDVDIYVIEALSGIHGGRGSKV